MTKRRLPTNADFINLIVGGRDILRLIDIIRSTIDNDPIDIPSLETSLREAIAAIQRIRSSGVRDKAIVGVIDSYEKYCQSLIDIIVGQQH